MCSFAHVDTTAEHAKWICDTLHGKILQSSKLTVELAHKKPQMSKNSSKSPAESDDGMSAASSTGCAPRQQVAGSKPIQSPPANNYTPQQVAESKPIQSPPSLDSLRLEDPAVVTSGRPDNHSIPSSGTPQGLAHRSGHEDPAVISSGHSDNRVVSTIDPRSSSTPQGLASKSGYEDPAVISSGRPDNCSIPSSGTPQGIAHRSGHEDPAVISSGYSDNRVVSTIDPRSSSTPQGLAHRSGYEDPRPAGKMESFATGNGKIQCHCDLLLCIVIIISWCQSLVELTWLGVCWCASAGISHLLSWHDWV